MKKSILSTAWLLLLSASVPGSLYAYQGGAVSHGGTIVGVVKFKGDAPQPKAVHVNKDQQVCGKSDRTDQALIVNNGDIADAVVFIANIDHGKKADGGQATLDQRGCEYKPHVLAFPAGTSVKILNPDGILHNIHSYSKKNSPFNLAQPKFKKTLDVKIEKPEIIKIQCDVHSWMHGWLFAADSPYFSVTDNGGAFKITDVPPGTYDLQVWQETLGTRTQKVTVKPDGETKVTFEMAKK